jgi:hypothetical protein
MRRESECLNHVEIYTCRPYYEDRSDDGKGLLTDGFCQALVWCFARIQLMIRKQTFQ